MKKRIIVALGGNAIKNKEDKGTYEEQMRNVDKTMKSLLPLLRDESNEVVITHGNGPQVGSLLIQNDKAREEVPAMPMFVCGAMTQGQLGFFIQQSLTNLFRAEKINRNVATIVTQVEVSKQDKAFENPTKPVGPFYSKSEAAALGKDPQITFKEDAGRGFRRVVPSPKPISIPEIDSIVDVIDDGTIAIACGGGGIPVYKEGSILEGVDAVIDKDKASALLGDLVDADLLIILTAVEKVSINFNKANQEDLDSLTISQAEKYKNEGHFAEGSMKPKIEAVIDFVKANPKRKALITHMDALHESLKKGNGTWIIA